MTHCACAETPAEPGSRSTGVPPCGPALHCTIIIRLVKKKVSRKAALDAIA
ncbi:hypothetical protein JYU34_019080 [Plutella xylostella]|uniref:Uncharacterized protein n=1 Tax=Plutella xylostella TaxID=51655 RepID=A0ABQ7PZ49_PLUXY|nr:hypothetical protein JYU34_019080 [Plutella xylostella]